MREPLYLELMSVLIFKAKTKTKQQLNFHRDANQKNCPRCDIRYNIQEYRIHYDSALKPQ